MNKITFPFYTSQDNKNTKQVCNNINNSLLYVKSKMYF